MPANDSALILTFYNILSREVLSFVDHLSLPGVPYQSTETTGEKKVVNKWVDCYVLNVVPVRSRKTDWVRTGIFQVNCFAKIISELNQMSANRMADRVAELLGRKSFPVVDTVPIGFLTLDDPEMFYIPETGSSFNDPNSMAAIGKSAVQQSTLSFKFTYNGRR